MYWIDLVQDKDRWRTLVNTVINGMDDVLALVVVV
jgi:hypothetical protein